jgi:DNA polymerase sigma
MINQVGQKDQKRAKKFEPQQCIRSYTNPYVGGTRKYNLRSTPSFNQLHSSSAQVVVVLPHGATAVVQAPPNIDQTKKMKTHNKQKKKDYSVIPDEFFVSWHPSALIVNPKFQELSRIHQDIFTKSRNTFSQRITFFNNLRGALTSNFPNMRFHVTGSSVTGVIFYDGDLDITVLPLSQQRFPADAILRTLKPVLSKCLGNERVVFIKARVPILKVDTLSALCPFPVDISFGSAMGIQGCYYLRRLLDMHSNARPLALLIKHWAFRVGILDSQRCLLSSHSILLMVIFYLQTVGILPMQDPTNTCDGLEIPIAPDPVDEPHLSIELCELFIGLLHFYSVFPFPSRCISVRQTNKTLPETSDCIRIQDPIDPMFNVARNVKSANMLQITEAFRTALHSWKPTMGY